MEQHVLSYSQREGESDSQEMIDLQIDGMGGGAIVL